MIFEGEKLSVSNSHSTISQQFDISAPDPSLDCVYDFSFPYVSPV
jgi:hypothetical protein